MAMERKDDIFSLLRQDGPFATGNEPAGGNPFSLAARKGVRQFRESGLVTRYRVTRNQIYEFLDVSSLAEIRRLIHDHEKRQQVTRRAYRMLGNMFGIAGSESEITSKINNYSRTADAVIRYLKEKLLSNYGPYIEMTNEVDALNNPVDLLLIMFDDRYHKKARFEAKRKLILMNLAGSIDQRERETDIENKFVRFLTFLNEYVWSKELKIGELEHVFLLSNHDPRTFACLDVKVVNEETAARVEKTAGRKLTLIKRRRFRANGRHIPIYVTVRKKAPEAKVLKLLRKGEENPAVAVDDELGLMGVVSSAADVRIFQKHLTASAVRANSFMTLEEVADTLNGGLHLGRNIGSSSKTSMLKFFARMEGMRVEFIVHTNKTYLNYIYQRDVSHDEYEVKRIFNTGVADLLFPREIFHLDMSSIKDEMIRWFRKRIEEN